MRIYNASLDDGGSFLFRLWSIFAMIDKPFDHVAFFFGSALAHLVDLFALTAQPVAQGVLVVAVARHVRLIRDVIHVHVL